MEHRAVLNPESLFALLTCFAKVSTITFQIPTSVTSSRGSWNAEDRAMLMKQSSPSVIGSIFANY